MMQLLKDIRAVMLFKKISVSKLAETLRKDSGTLFRQLDPEKGNPQLATIVEIVNAIGARLVVETDESLKAIEESDVSEYRARIVEMGAEISRLRDMIADKDSRIARRDKIIEEQKETISHISHLLDVKEEDLHKRDAIIGQCIKKQEELYEKLMQR